MLDVRFLLSFTLLVGLLGWTPRTLAVPPALPSLLTADFDFANKLYEQGKFTEATSAYEKLIQSGQISPALYFNLGNSLFKSGQIGRAVAAYRRAEEIAPRDPDLRANLQFVRNQIQGPTHLPDRWQRGVTRLTVNEWTVLASVGLWAWLLLLASTQFWPAMKRVPRGPALFSGIAAVALCLCLGAAVLTHSAQTAVVVAPEAAVHNGPLDESAVAFRVHDGAELTVLDRKDNWLQVSAGDRRVGWLKQEQVVLATFSDSTTQLISAR